MEDGERKKFLSHQLMAITNDNFNVEPSEDEMESNEESVHALTQKYLEHVETLNFEINEREDEDSTKEGSSAKKSNVEGSSTKKSRKRSGDLKVAEKPKKKRITIQETESSESEDSYEESSDEEEINENKAKKGKNVSGK